MKFILFILLFFLFFIPVFSQSTSKKTLQEAVKQADSNFFQKITLAELEKENIKDSTGKTVISKLEIAGVPALIGAFKNPDSEVRKIIYKELLFPNMFKDLKDISRPAQLLLQDQELKVYLDKIREVLYSVEEEGETKEALDELINNYGYSLKEAIKSKNSKAIAYMSPEFLRKSNLEDSKGVVNRFKHFGIKTLIKSLEYPKINLDTKKQIIDFLFYPSIGGPSKVLPKKKLRINRAESLFKLADKESDSDIKKKLIELAEAYYFAEDSESDKTEVIEKENSSKSKSSSK